MHNTHTAQSAQSPLWTRVLSAFGLAAIVAAIISMASTGTTMSAPLGSAATTPAPAAPAPAATTTTTTTADTAVTLTAVKHSTKPKRKNNGWKLHPMSIKSKAERTLRNHRPKSGSTVQRKTPKHTIRKSSTHTTPLVTR